MRSLILASASARRQELLARLGVDFEVQPAGIDEAPQPGEGAEALAVRLALEKARAVGGRHPASRVLGADTVVAQGSTLLGKPADAGQVRDWLQALSGREHRVVTGLALVQGERAEQASVVTRLWFRPLGAAEIDAYAGGAEPLDAAGAYAVQSGAARFVSRLAGSYTNVVGLPLAAVARLLERMEAAP